MDGGDAPAEVGMRLRLPRFVRGGAGIVLFLSYTVEDSGVAEEVAGLLADHGLDVDRWLGRQPMPTINGIDQRISQADAYIALLSPGFLADPLCRRERELAMSREQALRVSDPRAAFLNVLMVSKVDEPVDALPPRGGWVDLTDPATRSENLQGLVARLHSRAQGRPPTPGPGSVFFQNREEELEVAVGGLNNLGGPHFWLVIAPPQLGKTWFLDHLAARLLLEGHNPWEVKLVDVRDKKADVRTDAGALLACLFDADAPTPLEQNSYIRIARNIIASRHWRLCLIDSAELLAEDTASTLRFCLSEIHNRVSEAGQPHARLAVVVASRREDEWRGIAPSPRLSISALNEFTVEVVYHALARLAMEMGHSFERPTLERNAKRVHKLSEGLPALLARCIAWIRDQEWAGMERLETQELFEELAHPYIKDSLLASESLFPSQQGGPESRNGGQSAQSAALEHALRVLAPYRLFTGSHLRHYWDLDQALSESMSELGWTVQDLWRAISGSALLLRPLDELWQEIPRALRRLLYRYYYVTDAERAAAHREAHSFMKVWADQQYGKEQVVGLVECLWHEAVALRLEWPAGLQTELVASARVLSRGLCRSEAFTEDELRRFAAGRVRRDEEFQEVIDDGLLLNRIVAGITSPGGGEQ